MAAMSNNTMNDIESLVPILDAVDALPGAAELRARTYELLDLAPGVLVVEVGCGPGRAVAELAERGVRAVGVGVDEHMISIGRTRWPDAEFHVGPADDLPLDTGSAAGYRAEKVFHALDDPATALREAHRVLAPGGRIVLLGQDWDTFVIDSDAPALTRRMVHAFADGVPSPRAARQYRNLLLDTGFHDVTVEVHTGVFTDAMMMPMLTGIADTAHAAGAVSREQAEAWIGEQTERARIGRLFLAVPLFLAAAGRD